MNSQITPTKIICLISFSVLIACDFMVPKLATPEQRKQAMDNAVFDHSIDVHRYENLKNFLLSYGDTIIAYRDGRNIFHVHGGGGKVDTVLQKEDCYNFFQGNSSYDITNVPDFLKPRLDSIYQAIGDDNLRSFTICNNKEVRIEVRSEGGQNGLYISHNLLWNAKKERDYRYSDNRDTLLEEGCIYRLGMTEHHGH